jgi:NADPH2 dehydrogenase
MKILETYQIKNVLLKNRIVMPPMCMWMADEDGLANQKHLVHYVTRAVGGVGLIIVEATAVSPEGRIEPKDLGIWNGEQKNSFKALVEECHRYGAKMALQIAHAGRKGFDDANIVAPSPLAFSGEYGIPHELTNREILQKVDEFKAAALRAVQAGFDMIEVHAAHGYLIHEFLSPLTNKRTDEFGGSLENRVRFLKLILEGIREILPESVPLEMRVSASDYTTGGIDVHEMVKMINHVKKYLDLVHVSSGGLTETAPKSYPGYQVEFSRIIKEQCGIPTIAVGLIDKADLAEEIVENGRADLVALGRALLRNPYWTLNVAHANQSDNFIPKMYERGFRGFR